MHDNYSSASPTRHLVRGAVGIGSLVGAFVLLPWVGLAALVLLPVGLVAMKGCPTCWAIGLMQTLSRGRLERVCVDGVCELRASPGRSAGERLASPGRDHGRRGEVEQP
jgi:hypothetical protein